jgi:hypothetical protein
MVRPERALRDNRDRDLTKHQAIESVGYTSATVAALRSDRSALRARMTHDFVELPADCRSSQPSPQALPAARASECLTRPLRNLMRGVFQGAIGEDRPSAFTVLKFACRSFLMFASSIALAGPECASHMA